MAHVWKEFSRKFISDANPAPAIPSQSGLHEATDRPERSGPCHVNASENIGLGDSRSTILQACGSSHLNPEAPNFVPSATVDRPIKRRASSLVKPSKLPVGPSEPRFGSDHYDVKANDDYSFTSTFYRKLAPYTQPYVRTADLFGTDNDAEAGTLVGRHGSIQQSEDDSANMYDPLRTRLYSDFGRDGRDRASCTWNDLPPLPTEPCSAVLISRGQPSSSSSSDSACFKYLPLHPDIARHGRGQVLTVESSCRRRIEQASLRDPGSCQTVWPAERLPVEIFDLITYHLSRDDVASMRLVNHEFERKVARSLFHTSVIPFNTELYDMIQNLSRLNMPDSESTDKNSLHWQNTKDDKDGKLYKGQGLKVFQGFGPFIKRFGMTFEVSESQLSQPPEKKDLECLQSYHGSYPWPSESYTRFDDRARLERTADEISRMKAAFSHLCAVQELALSVDSGLGWLNGPDKSIRSLLINKSSPVFGRFFSCPDRKAQTSVDFWNAIQNSQLHFGTRPSVKDFHFCYRELLTTPEELEGLHGTQYADTRLWPAIDGALLLQNGMPTECSGSTAHFGVLYTTTNCGVPSNLAQPRLVPNKLRKEQKEWLLETQWAQRAFLESYVLAIVDNPSIFANVTSLRLARMSSQLLSTMWHPPFWKGLPSLRDVTLHVKPDWRTVGKDATGVAETSAISPTDALSTFQRLLRCLSVTIKTLKSLNVGWIGGGELAEGVFARNRHLLPAPIHHLSEVFSTTCNDPLVFNHVQHLTLTNCWITPGALIDLVTNHTGKSLKKLTLDYVSLTALPRSTSNIPQAPPPLVVPNLHPPPYVMPQGNQLPYTPAVNLLPQAGSIDVMNAAGNDAPGFEGLGPPASVGQDPGFGQDLINPQLLQHLHNIPGSPHNHASHTAPHLIMLPPVPPMTLPIPQLAVPPTPVPLVLQTSAASSHALSPNDPSASIFPTFPFTDCRPGSWPAIIDAISPGPVLADYRSTAPPCDESAHDPRPDINLEYLEFNSCGYVHFSSDPPLDQSNFDAWMRAQAHIPTSAVFRMKAQTLENYMMRSGPHSDRLCGSIVQHIPAREWATLRGAWGLWEGWKDREEANAVTYDGCLPGGTGRFSGTIWKGQPLIPTFPC